VQLWLLHIAVEIRGENYIPGEGWVLLLAKVYKYIIFTLKIKIVA
jgi:hypothetical protein